MKHLKSYEATYTIAKIFSGIGWGISGIGLFLFIRAFLGGDEMYRLIAGVLGGFSIMGGLFLIVSGQLIRAIVDIASSNQMILKQLSKE